MGIQGNGDAYITEENPKEDGLHRCDDILSWVLRFCCSSADEIPSIGIRENEKIQVIARHEM